MRGHTSIYNVFRDQTLSTSGLTTFSKEFPLGEGWHMMLLTFKITIGGSGMASAISEGELQIIKNILFLTDRDGNCVNCPGRGLFYLARAQAKHLPNKDAIAASTGDYYVSVPLFFSNPSMSVSKDSVLDTSRYQSVNLHLTMGGLTDLFGTVGSATLALSLSCDVLRTKGALPQSAKPLLYPYISAMPQVNPANQQYIELERSVDLALLMVMAHTANSVTSGEGFSGTNTANVLSRISIEDNDEIIFNERNVRQIIDQNEIEHHLDAVTGFYFFDFQAEGSHFGAYATGPKTRVQLKWVNDTLSTSGVTALVSGVRTLK
ncbi:MAG: hypothetical protein JSW62_04755 [Thermoplasmatales archaeon]|nr:MAG: hypothetical protein JSW62_04755 [Thermoplasmatales archaeon]